MTMTSTMGIPKELGTFAPAGPIGVKPDEAVPLYVHSAADVRVRPVRWLWNQRLPIGKLVMLAGEPGLGKSRVTDSLAAIVSRGGSWPAGEGRCEQGDVLIASFEDDEDDTTVPRLMAENANLSKIHLLQGVPDPNGRRGFNINMDVDRLDRHMELYPNTRLLIVDPISAAMAGTDTHKNADVRSALSPMVEVARRRHVCIVAITHFNKGIGAKAIHRIIGSIALAAAARTAYAVVRDEDDPERKRRLMLPVKNNLGDDKSGLSFTTRMVCIQDDAGTDIWTPTIQWGDETVQNDIDDSMEPQGEDQGKLAEAKQFLAKMLAGGPVDTVQLKKDTEGAGLTWATVRRAKDKMKVHAGKADFDGSWQWSLPAQQDRYDNR